jgi:hypothetical protein
VNLIVIIHNIVRETHIRGQSKLSNNPYQSTAVAVRPETPIRLRRGGRVLLLIAAITTGVSTWEIFNHNLFNGWATLPLQLFRVVFPLVLIRLIWSGRPWARYLLAGYSGFTLYVNLPSVAQLPEMISKGHSGNAILVELLFVGYVVVGATALFSSAISSLMNYRRDERELV